MLAAPAGSTPTTRICRVPRAQQRRDAGEQAAAADGHDDQVGRPAQLLEDLGADRALPGDRAGVVERGHQRRAGARGVLGRGGRGVVVGVAVDDQLDRVAAQRTIRSRFCRGVVRGTCTRPRIPSIRHA